MEQSDETDAARPRSLYLRDVTIALLDGLAEAKGWSRSWAAEVAIRAFMGEEAQDYESRVPEEVAS